MGSCIFSCLLEALVQMQVVSTVDIKIGNQKVCRNTYLNGTNLLKAPLSSVAAPDSAFHAVMGAGQQPLRAENLGKEMISVSDTQRCRPESASCMDLVAGLWPCCEAPRTPHSHKLFLVLQLLSTEQNGTCFTSSSHETVNPN